MQIDRLSEFHSIVADQSWGNSYGHSDTIYGYLLSGNRIVSEIQPGEASLINANGSWVNCEKIGRGDIVKAINSLDVEVTKRVTHAMVFHHDHYWDINENNRDYKTVYVIDVNS